MNLGLDELWVEYWRARNEQMDAKIALKRTVNAMKRADEQEAAWATLYKLKTGSTPPENQEGHERIKKVHDEHQTRFKKETP